MPFSSNEGYVGFARQTASGTYVAPTRFLYVKNIDITPDNNIMIQDPEIGGIRDITDNVQLGTIGWGGNIDFDARPEGIGHLVLSAMGAVTSSGIAGQSGAYGHLFTPESDCLPISIEKRVGGNSTATLLDVFGYQDCKVNTLRFECAAGEMVTGTAEVVAIEERSGKTNQTATYGTDPIFTFVNGIVNIEGVSYSVKNLSFELNNNIDTEDFRIGQRTRQTLIEQRRELSATLDIVPTDANVFKNAYFGSTGDTAVANTQTIYKGTLFIRFENPKVIGATSQKYSMDITIEEAAFRTAPLPMSGDDMIIQTLEMLPVKASGSNIVTIAIRNSIENYAT